MRILLPLVLSGGLLAPVGAWAVDGPVSILGQKQTAKIFEFPDMSLNQLDYRGISVEFAVGVRAVCGQLRRLK